MRKTRLLALAGAAVAALTLSGCVLPPPGHGPGGPGDRYDNRGDRDGRWDRDDGRWDRDGRPNGPPPGGYGPRY